MEITNILDLLAQLHDNIHVDVDVEEIYCDDFAKASTDLDALFVAKMHLEMAIERLNGLKNFENRFLGLSDAEIDAAIAFARGKHHSDKKGGRPSTVKHCKIEISDAWFLASRMLSTCPWLFWGKFTAECAKIEKTYPRSTVYQALKEFCTMQASQ